jgi:hypothetical protein
MESDYFNEAFITRNILSPITFLMIINPVYVNAMNGSMTIIYKISSIITIFSLKH